MQSSLGPSGQRVFFGTNASPFYHPTKPTNIASPLEYNLVSKRSGLLKSGVALLSHVPLPPFVDTQVGIMLGTWGKGQDGEPVLYDSRVTCCAVTGTLSLTQEPHVFCQHLQHSIKLGCDSSKGVKTWTPDSWRSRLSP